MACGGDNTEICGGSLRISVWKTATDSTSAPSTNAPTPAPKTYPLDYRGCYTDPKESGGDRLLLLLVRDEPATMTIELCIAECRAFGMQYAGLQYSEECYCGNDISTGTLVADTECAMPCPGDATEDCGGSFRNSIYFVDGVVQPPVYMGCFTDPVTPRALPMKIDADSHAMTIERCIERCGTAGYTYSGLQFALECYCGNSTSGGSLTSEDDCWMTCSGNDGEKCGSGKRNSVYKTSTPAFLEPYGCYDDDPNARTLPYLAADNDQMNVGYCIGMCASQGYTYAGVQFGRQCFCGNTLPPSKTYATRCYSACSGDPNQRCGGGNTNMVYPTTRSL
eukprot:TRINITY_DN1657_c0_g1_i4.p1 TRINITY_DN1657_c0_g1~~TRINITY_DN1657_c0_g1_i4.p1  ORF type:complete len:370 (+),score=104.67 TRINITY_DN1657_c0_g1_i4:104-1111(+)